MYLTVIISSNTSVTSVGQYTFKTHSFIIRLLNVSCICYLLKDPASCSDLNVQFLTFSTMI